MIQVIQEGANPQSLAKTAIKLPVPEKRNTCSHHPHYGVS